MKDSGYELKPSSEEIRMIQGQPYFNPEAEDSNKYAVTF